jgi:hypothetical protein
MIDFIGLMMLAEGESKLRRRRTEGDCDAPVARFGVWVGPFQLRMIRELHISLILIFFVYYGLRN